MKLTILERIRVAGLLPKESDFTTLGIIRGLKEKLTFTEEELKKFGITSSPYTGTTWSQEYNKTVVEIKIGEILTKMIVDKLKELESSRKLKDEDYTVYEKFVVNKK